LDALHRRGQLQPKLIDRLAQTLVRFYQSLPPARWSAEEYRERFAAHVIGNRRELLAASHNLPPDPVRRACGFQLELLRLRPELFDARIRAGRIVGGHGDLRPEHICFTEPIAIFDCIEFNAEFRTLDIADELAFLAAECDFLGAEWVGPQLRAAYEHASGDCVPTVLWDFYKSYRTCVRAKVAALRAAQLSGEQRAAVDDEARRHLTLADQYASSHSRPLVIAVGGLAGTGKTTLATEIAELLGAELLRTDVLRQELYGTGPHAVESDGGIYAPAARGRVYGEILKRARSLHSQGSSTVLDGTFATLDQLQQARAVATQPRSGFLAVECVCRAELARERIRGRLTAGSDASEARPETHDLQRIRWEAWPAEMSQVRIDTEQPLDVQVQRVLSALRSHLESELAEYAGQRQSHPMQGTPWRE
jgi:predicted kinase